MKKIVYVLVVAFFIASCGSSSSSPSSSNSIVGTWKGAYKGFSLKQVFNSDGSLTTYLSILGVTEEELLAKGFEELSGQGFYETKYITENAFFLSICSEDLGNKSIHCAVDVVQIKDNIMTVKDLVHNDDTNDETRIPTINKDCDGATIADKNKIIECVSSNMKKSIAF